MNRKACLVLIGANFPLLSALAAAQTGTGIPTIGFLTLGPRDDPRVQAFFDGLKDLGYEDGRNIRIEYRSGGLDVASLPALARELVLLSPAVIVALSPPTADAASKASTSVPLVIRTGDPVASRLVKSLAHPGGNITGVSSETNQLYAKRLQLLAVAIPGLARVGVLQDSAYTTPTNQLSLLRLRDAATSLRIELRSINARSMREFLPALHAARQRSLQGIVVVRSPLFVNNRKQLVAAEIAAGLPAIYDEREFVEAGGLMSYGANLNTLYRLAATYVDRIIKGAKPADLPIEQPTQFEMLLNARTASALGLTFPQSIVMQAAEVIK